MAKKFRTIYRDTKTGWFAKKETWKRSKKRGSKRYKRQRVKAPEKKQPPPPPPPPPQPEEEVHEYVVSYSYERTGRTFDVVVTARSEEEARAVGRQFLSRDRRGQRINKSGFSGWSELTARGKTSAQEAGEAEYREDSEE